MAMFMIVACGAGVLMGDIISIGEAVVGVRIVFLWIGCILHV